MDLKDRLFWIDFRTRYWKIRKSYDWTRDAIWNIYDGIGNLIKWAPIIWRDRWWDWVFLAKIIEFKLRDDAKWYQSKRCWTLNGKRHARQMLICAELLKRLIDDEHVCFPKKNKKIPDLSYFAHDYNMHGREQEYRQKYLFKLMDKHFRGWWD